MRCLYIDAVNQDLFYFLLLHHSKLLMNSVRPVKHFCISCDWNALSSMFKCVQGHSWCVFTVFFKGSKVGSVFLPAFSVLHHPVTVKASVGERIGCIVKKDENKT